MKSYQFRDKLVSDIRSGHLSAGEYIGTSRELAERYSMSEITMNRTLSAMASEGLLERIRNRGTYVSNSVKIKKCLNIGLAFVVPQNYALSGQQYLSAFQIFPDFAKEHLRDLGYNFVDFSYEDLLRPDFDLGCKLNGLLITSGALDVKSCQNLIKKDYPIVTLQHCLPRLYQFHQIIPDLFSAYIKLIAELRKKQFHKLNLLSGCSDTQQDRRDIFLKAAEYNNFSPQDIQELIIEDCIPGDLGQLAGYKLGLKALNSHKKGKVYFVTSDIIACGILNAFMENKLEPLKDFHLISFDNLEEDAQFFPDKAMISSIDFPKKDIIKRAIKLIEEEISEPSKAKYIIQVPCELIERETFRYK